jgi:hypothetical protein
LREFGSWANAPVTFNDIKSGQVIGRLCLRIIVLCVFAAFGGVGFSRSLAALLMLSAAFCVVGGVFRRETPSDTALTHWDEAAVYGLLYGLISVVGQVSAH